ncbi:MAG: lipid A deacylase LpxR family protein, partial [Enhydrobacter sp.]
MRLLILAAAALMASVVSAAAQRVPTDDTPDPDELRNIFSFQVENDVFNRFGKSDRDYTNGFRFGWLSPALPSLPEGIAALTTVPTFFGESAVSSVTRRIGVLIGQNIYTPQNTDISQPIFNDRPYAAWLYASVALQQTYKRNDAKTGRDEPVRQDTLQLDFGVVGPAAGGEFVQNNFHKLIGVSQANGWANQLYNEPTIGLTFERRWRTGHNVLFDSPKLEYD